MSRSSDEIDQVVPSTGEYDCVTTPRKFLVLKD